MLINKIIIRLIEIGSSLYIYMIS